MSLILDIATLTILGLSIFLAYKRGFLRTIIDMAGKVAAFIAAYIFASPLANYINKHYITPGLQKGLVASLKKDLGASVDSVDINRLIADMPQFIRSIFTGYQTTPDEIIAQLPQGGQAVTYPLDDIAGVIVSPLARSVSYVVAFVLLFVVFLIIVAVISRLAGLLNEIPILKGINRTAGLALGLVNGVLLVFILSFAFGYVLPYLEKDGGNIINSADKTLVYHYFDQYNPLKLIFGTERAE